MSAAQEQRFLWLSAALVQAGLTSLLAEAATWMRTEEAVIADFSRGVTISDLGAALSLTNTQLKRLRSVIESLVPDTVPLPEIEVSLRDVSSEENECDGRDWKRSPSVDPEHNRTSELPSRSSAPPAPVLRPPPGPAPGQASSSHHLRWCKRHGKWRDPDRTFQLSNGDFECSPTSICKGFSAPDHPKSDRKGSGRAPKAASNPDSAVSSRLPRNSARREPRGTSRSPDHGHRRRKRKSPSGPPLSRHPSPKRRPLTSPRAIADSLFLFMDVNHMNLERSDDGYFKLKDIMKTWGRKHALNTEDVLGAIGGSMFKRMRNEMRANFLVYQEDVVGADISVSIPERTVR
jgi:hypothetical protein